MDWDHLDARRLERAIREMSGRMRFSVSGDLRVIVVRALWDFLDRMRTPASPTFTIDTWTVPDNQLLEQIAQARNSAVAVAAYEEAVRQSPTLRVTLRNGIRVMRASDGDRARREIEG